MATKSLQSTLKGIAQASNPYSKIVEQKRIDTINTNLPPQLRESAIKGTLKPIPVSTTSVQPAQTQTQATIETGTVYVPGVGLVDKATSRVIQPETAQSQAPSVPDVLSQRQAMLDQMRQQLGIQKTRQQETIRSAAEKTRQDIQARYLQGKSAELERLVNQGQVSGLAGAEQSGLARSEILARQLSAENQSQAVTTQAEADIAETERQYNDLIAQGEIEKARGLIEDAWKKYEAENAARQYQTSLGLQERDYQTQLKQYEESRKTQAENTAYQREIDAAQTEYERNRQAEQDALDEWYKYQTIAIKTKAQKLAEEKAKQAYENAKARTAISAGNLSLAKQKFAKQGQGGTTPKNDGLGIFYNQ